MGHGVWGVRGLAARRACVLPVPLDEVTISEIEFQMQLSFDCSWSSRPVLPSPNPS